VLEHLRGGDHATFGHQLVDAPGDGLMASPRRQILHLDDLQPGAERRVIIALGTQGWPGLAWSPDSRWRFSVAGNGTLQVIGPRTGQVRSLGVALPPVTYLAVRDAG